MINKCQNQGIESLMRNVVFKYRLKASLHEMPFIYNGGKKSNLKVKRLGRNHLNQVTRIKVTCNGSR